MWQKYFFFFTVVYFPSWHKEGKVSWCARRTLSIMSSVSGDSTYTSVSTCLLSSFFFLVLSLRTTEEQSTKAITMGRETYSVLLLSFYCSVSILTIPPCFSLNSTPLTNYCSLRGSNSWFFFSLKFYVFLDVWDFFPLSLIQHLKHHY